ncbi:MULTISPECIES: histidinol-phosphate transaminase [Shewanella]|uniref:histidinol-phosphate transaminase n=1 Tax=Shewanella TaxID=22 RepID=UPI000C662968|nr:MULTISPECIES: histidinol-phosphate transaminase [Shewanella]NCQ45895.1 histidinol-phosphate transaminase [Shewanella frigidimarina]NCO72092.1 histidinol-phosphate transaminase [Shewanella vesiculosa]NCP36576.1 histidinol-phosphate transaminase [Shewanella vesiculosa]NCP70879.1 histidinol-phosphate transaminase [Shewanella vesiculosa]NCP75400.1 histidinol-phosphate transaminase [Shewanella vesiculosa]
MSQTQVATFDPNTLARPELLTLTPYQSARRIGGRGDIWINANESPFNNSDLDKVNRYPECQPPELINAYSSYSGVKASNIIASRGADEAIELLIRTFCIPGVDSIACFGPTYGMYSISAATFNVAVTALSLTDNYQLPDAWPTQIGNAKVVFICNPNNPTGTVLAKDKIEQAIQAAPNSIVVVDEAYIEFCPDYSVADLLDQYPNLVVLRTLSKAFALAGARCGFMLASDAIIDLVMRVIAPYPVPLPVSELAVRALSPAGIDTMRTQVASLIEQGQRLSVALTAYGAKVLPANGNYMLAKFDDVSAAAKRLSDSGVVARAYKDPRLADAIRFSFTNEQQTNLIIALFEKALSESVA